MKKMTKKEKFISFIKRAEDVLFEPHSCICCGRECDTDSPYRICSRCEKVFPYIGEHYCLKCGTRIGENYDFCLACKDKEYQFDSARAIFEYNDLTRPIILNFKFNGRKTYAPNLGKMLADYFATSDLMADVVTFVPMPAKRKKQRGFNQAEELAKEFSLLTEIPLVDALDRVKDIPQQSTLSGKERIENVKGNFIVKDKNLVKGKTVLLIDDVVTTGATVNECAAALKKGKANEVFVLSLARTVSDKLG